MGIRGLTTYISQHSQHFHEPFRLHDCFLVIDGNSLASKLYVDVSKCNSAFGGDYNNYAASVSNFFLLLSKCNVTPLVVIDGGYETRKLKTVECRLKAKLQAAQLCSTLTQQSTIPVFPLLMKDVFKQTLRSIGVKFVQSDFEADYEVAAIARHLNCPVLSYDSDYYVLDVLYIPFSTLNLHTSKARSRNGSVKLYMKCEAFRAERFVKHFGGLDKALLPLMATLLGNDYVSISVFEKFYLHVKLPKTKKLSAQQKRICAVFEWLRKESVDSAKEKIINYFKKDVRKQIRKEIDRSLAGYRQCKSDLLLYFNLNTEAVAKMNFSVEFQDESPLVPTDTVNAEDSEDWSDDNDSEDALDESSLECLKLSEEILPHRIASISTWPEWMVDMFRKGNLPSYVSDMYYLQMFFCQPQVEDFTSEDAHAISFPILRISYGLLMSDNFLKCESSKQSKKTSLTCLTRGSGTKVLKFELEPILSLPCLSPFPTLALLPAISVSLRREILFSAMGFENDKDTKILMLFPDNWILFAMVVVYWGRNCAFPKVNKYHLNAVLLTWIILGVVDSTLNSNDNRNHSDTVKPCIFDHGIIEVCSKDPIFETIPDNICKQLSSVHSTTLKKYVSMVTANDCQLLVENLSQFRNVQSKHLRGHKQLSLGFLHLFAQLQTCLQQAMTLNSLLSNAFPPINVSNTFSGSLAFSTFMSLYRVNDIETFIKLLLKECTVWHLYESLIILFKELLPDLSLPLRKFRKRTKRKIQIEDTPSSEDMPAESEEEGNIFDKNNKFSLLSTL